ncbi:hypothetical protein ACFPRL_23685 [Pseudoclavibacter helvolus]
MGAKEITDLADYPSGGVAGREQGHKGEHRRDPDHVQQRERDGSHDCQAHPASDVLVDECQSNAKLANQVVSRGFACGAAGMAMPRRPDQSRSFCPAVVNVESASRLRMRLG